MCMYKVLCIESSIDCEQNLDVYDLDTYCHALSEQTEVLVHVCLIVLGRDQLSKLWAENMTSLM